MTATPRPFIFNKFDYKRDGDPLKHWVKAQTDYITKLYDYPRDYVEKWVKDSIKEDGCSPFFDRKVHYIHQTSPGNREEQVSSFYAYQKTALKEGYVLSPSQTAYKDPVKNPSIMAKFTKRNADLRGVYKKTAQDAKVKGNKPIAAKYGVLQLNTKELNNSFSGANSSWFNALGNASGHQALTSTCRSATSYANIICERFLMGNRVYIDADIVVQELSNACLLADLDLIWSMVKQYGLKVPTPQDVYETAEKSFSKYFRSREKVMEIKLFISTMGEAARCAFVYLGDLYHLDKFNPWFVEDLFKELAEFTKANIEPTEELYNSASDDMRTLVFSLLKDLTKGKVYKDFMKDENPEGMYIINNTIKAYYLFFEKYEKFINALWRPTYLPSGMAYLRTMLREAILTSDTDSAIGTTQYWTKRITGSYNFEPESFMVCFNLIYFTSESVANAFGKLCANMGVPGELIDQLGAKNEYYFPIYVLTEAMKHYFNWKMLEEGRVLAEPELEKKGVGFISARYFPKIQTELDEYIENDILSNIMKNINLTKEQVLGRPMRLEQEVRETIRSGGIIYQTDNIKTAASYKTGEENATYRQYLLWQEVFAPTYGVVDEPPYSAYKIPVALSKKRHVNAWVENIQDRALAGRLRTFLDKHDLEQMSAILVPTQIAEQNGVPVEIVEVVDEMRATSQIMQPFYLGLGGLGFFYGNSSRSKLISDYQFIEAKSPSQTTPLSQDQAEC